MKKKYLILEIIGLTFIGIIFIFSVKVWAGTLIPISSATYNGPADGWDEARGVSIDGIGNIIVAGRSFNGTNDDYFTIKYNSDLSIVLASATYNGPTNGSDIAYAVAIDEGGNIIVTGFNYNGPN